ncbi:MAG TPA: hypothetical protein PLU10_00545 [Chitinophagaceae bacterium]|nr:hypothetical protein [Chitinophagaceae bacterium]
MKMTFARQLQLLHSLIFQFDEQVTPQKLQVLMNLSSLSWKTSAEIISYQEILLFMLSHPDDRRILNACRNEIKRITTACKTKNSADDNDSGLPYTNLQTRFSPDLMAWLATQTDCRLDVDSFEEEGTSLNEILRLTLPAVERDETTAGLDNSSLLDALSMKPSQQVAFLLDQFQQFDTHPLTKDFLWESMKGFFTIRSLKPSFSRLENRIAVPAIYFHTSLLKRFDAEALLQMPLPSPVRLDDNMMAQVCRVIRYSLALTLRETDPSTFMEPSSLRLYHLERGISVALYGMKANRQLSLQSYIGYTLFKNGYPLAYGGSWIFGQRANFGLNIFEAFRGGESGYVMCQLLRTYIHAFQLTHVEVEPYQYGLDNPDGIASGAFWFYYKYGFRPVDEHLNTLATKEFRKIQSQAGYRSSEKTLLRFTESNIELHRDTTSTPPFDQVVGKISRLIRTSFKGQRQLALQTSREQLQQRLTKLKSVTAMQSYALDDVSLLSAALTLNDERYLSLLHEMIKTKATNPYRYNQLLVALFRADSF